MKETEKKPVDPEVEATCEAETNLTVAELEEMLEEKNKLIESLKQHITECSQLLRASGAREEQLVKIVKAQAALIGVLYHGEGES